MSNFLTCAFVDFVLFPAFVSSSFFSSSFFSSSPFTHFSFPGDRRANANCLSVDDVDEQDDAEDHDDDDDEVCFTSSVKLCIQGTVWQPLHPHRWI